jgi:hypothetical protein
MMNEWETLAEIDHAMMQVDIDMMEWQGHLDMAALAGVGQPFQVWTNDDPPVVVTKENFEDQAGKTVRLMTFSGGEWSKIGDGTMTPSGKFQVWVPKTVGPYEHLVSTEGSGVVEIPEVIDTFDFGAPKPDGLKRFAAEIDLETHPFFDKE